MRANACETKGTTKMEKMEFTVLRLDGDYAILSAEESDAQIPMARALLPEEITEGTRLLYVDFAYSILP